MDKKNDDQQSRFLEALLIRCQTTSLRIEKQMHFPQIKKYTNWAKVSSLILTEQEETKTKCFAPLFWVWNTKSHLNLTPRIRFLQFLEVYTKGAG